MVDYANVSKDEIAARARALGYPEDQILNALAMGWYLDAAGQWEAATSYTSPATANFGPTLPGGGKVYNDWMLLADRGSTNAQALAIFQTYVRRAMDEGDSLSVTAFNVAISGVMQTLDPASPEYVEWDSLIRAIAAWGPSMFATTQDASNIDSAFQQGSAQATLAASQIGYDAAKSATESYNLAINTRVQELMKLAGFSMAAAWVPGSADSLALKRYYVQAFEEVTGARAGTYEEAYNTLIRQGMLAPDAAIYARQLIGYGAVDIAPPPVSGPLPVGPTTIYAPVMAAPGGWSGAPVPEAAGGWQGLSPATVSPLYAAPGTLPEITVVGTPTWVYLAIAAVLLFLVYSALG